MLACALLVAVGASGVQLGASRVGAARAAVASRRFAPRVLRAEPETAASADVADDGLTDKQREIQRLRDAEVFMVKDTGRYECRTCSYVYDPEKGDGFCARAAASSPAPPAASGARLRDSSRAARLRRTPPTVCRSLARSGEAGHTVLRPLAILDVPTVPITQALF